MSFTVRYLKEAYLHIYTSRTITPSNTQTHDLWDIGIPLPRKSASVTVGDLRKAGWWPAAIQREEGLQIATDVFNVFVEICLMYLYRRVILYLLGFFLSKSNLVMPVLCCGILLTSLCWCFKIPKSRKVLVSIEARRHLPNQFGKEMQVNTEKCRYHT